MTSALPANDGVAQAAGGAVEAAWRVLHTVPDPELPAVSVCDLGIVRDVVLRAGHLIIVLTPTYSGCPATELIEQQVLSFIDAAGLGPVQVEWHRAPAWTSDWISAAGRQKLRDHGIAPPGRASPEANGGAQAQVMRFVRPTLACPRCGSRNTETLSAFGSTACKALHRCLACLEPFEHFKPI